jgi:DNA-binding SARP family transcriptional activator/tetratricopeptide (TPR) repeat protein
VPGVRFRVLGPVEIDTEGAGVLGLSRRQERCLLAVLLLEPDRLISVDRLCDLLWDGEPPDQARRAVHSHVARVRAVLARAGAADAGVSIVSQGDGYRILVDPDLVDAHRFRALVERAAATPDLSRREEFLHEALDLWRGPALQNAASDRLRIRLCAELEELRLHAVEESMATGLALGRHRELTPELARLTADHPTRERLVELHMLALYRSGRTGDALEAYARARTRLAEELGLDPGAALRRLQGAILRGEPVPASGPDSASPVGVRPAQLPADLVGFAGRAEHLGQLDKLVAEPTTAVVISAIAGTAGIGKTSLAVHWAHSAVDRYPDGQLYVNLRGFDPGGAATGPAEAVRGFLDALGVAPQRVPVGLDAQVGLYRSLLSGKRMLVLLDNARDAEQVRPLLPGSAGCLTLITSRNQLPGLVVTDGAHPLALDLLTSDESRELLVRRLGADRVAAEPGAVDEIIAACARLPLALAVVAARAAVRPGTPLAALAGEMSRARGGLEAFAGEDRATDARAVFSWSYHLLGDGAARLFRLLGLHPGPDVPLAAAASLLGVPPAEAAPLLAELAGAHLLTEQAGRYRLHDLLRAYAGELAHLHEPADERHHAVQRMLDHYLHSAHAGDLILSPRRDPITLVAPYPGVTVAEFTDHGQVMDWFTAEHPVLLAAVRLAAGTGFPVHTWQLSWSLATFLDRQGHWHDAIAMEEAALAATRRLGDRSRQANSHRYLARTFIHLGRPDDALAQLRDAIELYGEVGDDNGRAHTLLARASVLGRQGRSAEALDQARQALDLYEVTGHRTGQANAFNSVGWFQIQLGDHREALVHCRQALALNQEFGDRSGQAGTWDSLGLAHHHLGEYAEAVACYREAIDLYRDLGDRYYEADTLVRLGRTHQLAGHLDEARTAWQRALTIFEELGHPRVEEVRGELAGLAQGSRG